MLSAACAQPAARSFVSFDAPVIAITHVRVIDGTGRPATDDQTVVIENGRIRTVANAALLPPPVGAHLVDGRGHTLIPGLVGMHEHLFYQMDDAAFGAQAAFARLYLASGVTTIRTAGTIDFDEDLRLKARIDTGRQPGPKIHVTGPYLNTAPGRPDPERIVREANAQADRGATSFKAYTSLRKVELQALIDTAHARGLRVTGHLCAVGFREAAALGIDSLEHGLAMDSELYADKVPDVCPDQGAFMSEVARADVRTDRRIHRVIGDLVRHGVAVTSTLAVIETFTGRESARDDRMPTLLASRLRTRFERTRAQWSDPNALAPRLWTSVLAREMEFERAFVAAGGRLMAGVDPTGWGGLVAGYGDQRELELLVEAGLSPETAIRVATANGADYLREGNHIGTVEPGKQADLVLVRGNPSTRISDVRNVQAVFKDGVPYDPAALIASTQGTVGQYELKRIFRWPFNVLFVSILALLVARRVVRRRRSVLAPSDVSGAQESGYA